MARRWDRLTAALLLAFGGYTVVAGAQMGYWQERIPGPGFAPIWIGAGLALAAISILLRRAPSLPPTRAAPERSGPQRELVLVATIAAATAAAVLLVPWVGLMTAVGVLLLALVKVLGGSWRTAITTAALLPVGFYVVFVRWLQVPVPRGPWGF